MTNTSNFYVVINPFTMASSNSGGVKVMNIGGRVMNERERLIGMLDEERAWRARFLKSQHLAPDEPLMSKEYYKHYYNPFRRFYRVPLNAFERLLTPVVGAQSALIIRYCTAKILMGMCVVYGGWYYYNYNTATWMRQSGWRKIQTRPAKIPGTKDYKGLEKPPKPFATFDLIDIKQEKLFKKYER
ncbi:hypothetical protein WN51_06588 [Melipona quadrifasciata]|uniref:Uncharacterized protein n=1 Tax=Melipona quadrifasciata TaxID=166423 RepID=A0A0N0U3L3_9HYME|nr:hypothetical protein WN51_06588 [Melipona quadrifasciata]